MRLALAALFTSLTLIFVFSIFAMSARAETCQTIFKAGIGVIDSCTGDPASPYRDLPTRTPTPPPPSAPIVIVVPAPMVNVKVTVKTFVNATPTPSCGYFVNILGRCPVPGDKWVYDSTTGKVQ